MRFLMLVLVGLALGCGERSMPVSPVSPSGKELSVESVESAAGKSVSVSARYANAFLATARSGNLGVMRYLVRLGASVEATDDDGATALHLAAGAGHLDVVEYLVEEQGLDVAATNDAGDTALDVAAAEGHTAVVAYLEPLAAVAEPEEVARTPEEARAALDRLGIRYWEQTFRDSAAAGNLAVVKLFVDAGKDVNGWKLHLAARSGHLEVVQYLVEQGADVGTLHGAAHFGHLSIVKFLVAQGANVNAVNNGTALHNAASSGNLAVVRYLVEQGADVNATNDWGGTARSLAEKEGHTEVVAYLESVGG